MGQSLSSLSSSGAGRLGIDSSSPVIGFRDYSDHERHLLRLLRARAQGAPDPPLLPLNSTTTSSNNNDPQPDDAAQKDKDSNDQEAPSAPGAPVIDALSPKDLPAPLSTLLLHHSFAANDLVPIDTVVAILRQYLVAIPSLPPSPAALRHRDTPLATSAAISHVSVTDDPFMTTTSMDDDLSSALSSSLSEASLASNNNNNPQQRIQQQQQQQQQQRSSRGSSGRAAVSPLPLPSLTRGHSSPHLSSKLSLGIGMGADDSMSSSASASLFSLTLPDVLPLRMSDLDSQVNVGLCSKGLVQLTPWIAHVKNATVLQLCCNSLSTLPPHIAHLQHLTVLSVAKNLLTSLPLELGHLTQLVELDVSHNRLTDLPNALGHLRKLHILRVDHNRIAKLPRALGRLTNLVSLDVSDNPLTTLPAELARLKHLRKLRTRNCPLTPLASHSPLALGTPDPPSRVPTLRELAARKLVAANAAIDLAHLPRDLAAYLVSYDHCAFCSGPMFDHRVVRSRKFVKNDHVLPLEFELCSSHWSSERERVRALFSTPTSSTTRDAEDVAWKEANRLFAAKPAAGAQPAGHAAASSPALQPARTGSPKPPSLFGFASSPVLSPVAGPALVPPMPRSRTPSLPWMSLTRSRKHTAASNTAPDLPTSPSLTSLFSPEFASTALAPSTPTLVAGYFAAADYYTPAPHADAVQAHMADVFDFVSTTACGTPLPTAGPITALAAIRRMPLLPPVPARHPPPPPPVPTAPATHAPSTPTMRSSLSLPASPRLNKRSMSVPQLPRSVTSSALGFISRSRSRTPTPAPALPMVDEAAFAHEGGALMVPPRVPSGAGWRDPEDEIEVAPAPELVQHVATGAAAFPDIAARTVTPPASVYGSDVGVEGDEMGDEAEADADASFKSTASQRSSRLGGWVARVSRLGGRWGARRDSANGASAAGAAAAAGDEEGVDRTPSLMAAQAE